MTVTRPQLRRVGLDAAVVVLTVVLGVAINQILNGGVVAWVWLAPAAAFAALLDWAQRRRSAGGAARAPGGALPAAEFEERYRQYVLDGITFIDQRGLATIGPYTPKLEDVYVDVSLAHRAPHRLSGHPLADLPGRETERRSLGDFFGLPEPCRVAVTGAPGSGKTTLLRHTAQDLCRLPPTDHRSLPVLIYFREHQEAMTGTTTLPELITMSVGGLGALAPPGTVERWADEGRCVVLLDGLDEIASEDRRREVSAWVESQIQRFPGNDYVVTARPQGYRAAPIAGAVVLQARPFTDAQVERFVRGWYLATESLSTGESGEATRRLADESAEDLLGRLQLAPELYDLTTNPLLLTMIANVHRFHSALPGSRSDLYRDICEVMLWRRQLAKRLSTGLRGEHKERVLRGLAYTMMRLRIRDLPQEALLAEVSPALNRLSDTVTPEEFVADVATSGLMVETEEGVYSFAHLTFQEYLAAAFLRDERQPGPLVEAIDDSWWRESILLYVNRAPADPIVVAALESGTPDALALALDCADENPELAPDLRRRLNELITTSLAGAPEQRLLLTHVLLSRQMRRRFRAEDNGHLCAEPVGGLLYRLFLDDAEARGEHRPPDVPLPPASHNDSVTGIRHEDAEAFVAWVNRTVGAQVARLPTGQELDGPAARRAFGRRVPSAWVSRADGLQRRWTPAGLEEANVLDESVLAEALADDLRDLVDPASLEQMSATIRLAMLSELVTLLAEECADRADPGRLAEISRLMDTGFPAARLVLRVVSMSVPHRAGGPPRPDLLHCRMRTIAADLRAALAFAPQAGRMGPTRFVVRDAAQLWLSHEVLTDQSWSLTVPPPVHFERVARAMLGHALGEAVSFTALTVMPEAVRHGFSERVIQMAGGDRGPYVVRMEALADLVRESTAAVQRLSGQGSARTWSSWVAENLRNEAIPVFERRREPTSDDISAVRLMALCLAAQAGLTHQATTRALCEIAAGITLLGRRLHSGAPGEALILGWTEGG
ncbi:NACHT domain-containing protein [Actinomadura fulvescens]|uniref:NACHT domain-containing protein n=1 Tax=Actinomadura fulvescens TaxID=46160 RepID=A0ABP6BY43_9ACTN